jgi:hypothetical protein
MRILILIICAALSVSAARSEVLSAADREMLLENLEKLRDTANAKVDARFRIAIARYRAAMGSDEAALALYLECYELVNFKEQRKKTSDFLEWKRQDDVKSKLSDTGFRLALRYQLSWLVLTLQASSEKANLKALGAEAQELVDAIFRDADKLAGQEQELNQGVTSTVFARAYEIGNLENDKWPASPVQLDEFYGKIVFPPLRTPFRIDTLRAAWIKRIHQEGIKIDAGWSKVDNRGNNRGNGRVKGDKGDKTERKIGMASALKGPEYERFITETLPELQWRMEVDLFRSGDESAAALRMLAHIEKHLNHKQARKWGDEFKNLLKPRSPLAPSVPTGTLTGTPTE